MNSKIEITKTTCPYCGVGCGVEVSKVERKKFQISGDKSHPANKGLLCTKGRLLGETLSSDSRLSTPQMKTNLSGGNQHKMKNVSWGKSVAYVAHQFQNIIKEHGPNAVAFYVSGQLLTEDYYVANKLMKGFIGSGNIDTNSRLCMSSPSIAQKKAFGSDSVPMCYSDLEHADLIVITGSNLAWCHPVLYQRIRAEKKRRPGLKIVLIDPRKTATSEISDLHLAIKAGNDLLLFNALLGYLFDHKTTNQEDFTANNFDETIQACRGGYGDLDELSKILSISRVDLDCFFELFRTNNKVITLYSQGINQSVNGVNQANAIINCHLLTNRIGKPGMGPFSITGQPNAMGGREVGGMATSLACHLNFHDNQAEQMLSEFWNTNSLAKQPGLTAVELFEAIDQEKIKAIWIMATNPAVSMPNTNKVKRALLKCPLVVVSEAYSTSETLNYADVIFPAQAWGEKSGTVTNSERRISRQRAFRTHCGDSLPDWKIICNVAKAMGFTREFNYQNEADIFREHAQLSSKAVRLTGSFDITSLANITNDNYSRMTPIQWPQKDKDNISLGDIRLFSDGKFHNYDARPNMIPTPSLVSRVEMASNNAIIKTKSSTELEVTKLLDVKASSDTSQLSFVLNSGRNRDQWHSMTRTSLSHGLNSHRLEPKVLISTSDAHRVKITSGDLIALSNKKMSINIRCEISHQVKKGELFAPIHWSSVNSSIGSINQLINNERDPVSHQPAFKQAKVMISVADYSSSAQLLSRSELTNIPAEYWVKHKIRGGYLYSLASRLSENDFHHKMLAWLKTNSSAVNQTSLIDNVAHQVRNKSVLKQSRMELPLRILNSNSQRNNLISTSAIAERQLQWYLRTSKNYFELESQWLEQAFVGKVTADMYCTFISNIPRGDMGAGLPLCLCKNVSLLKINNSIARLEIEKSPVTVKTVCTQTGAGDACGSCLGDIYLVIESKLFSHSAFVE